ncbi:MAG: hypothetical protein M1834_009350 [Cirrosporium novae-zelandiae]|nr:MAG: hypothetical protein M1834_009350 [Cirrosporium novae-zelandiae]
MAWHYITKLLNWEAEWGSHIYHEDQEQQQHQQEQGQEAGATTAVPVPVAEAQPAEPAAAHVEDGEQHAAAAA